MIFVIIILGILALLGVVATIVSVARDGYGSREHTEPPAKEWQGDIR